MPVQFRDYYETLGVPKTATEGEIRSAFRKLARKYHPDVAKDKKAAEEKFKEINEAYEVLGDPEKRRKYDQLGPNWKQGGDFRPPPGWGGAGRARGAGVEADIMVTLEEAAKGGIRSISLRRMVPCPQCLGAGNVNGRTCPQCRG